MERNLATWLAEESLTQGLLMSDFEELTSVQWRMKFIQDMNLCRHEVFLHYPSKKTQSYDQNYTLLNTVIKRNKPPSHSMLYCQLQQLGEVGIYLSSSLQTPELVLCPYDILYDYWAYFCIRMPSGHPSRIRIWKYFIGPKRSRR